MNDRLRAEFLDPESRREQIELSRQRVVEYQQLADRANDHWRQTWLEFVKLHQAVIDQLEEIERMKDESV